MRYLMADYSAYSSVINGCVFACIEERWLPEDTKKFEVLAKKVADFYSSFEIIPGVNVNGKLTLGENIFTM